MKYRSKFFITLLSLFLICSLCSCGSLLSFLPGGNGNSSTTQTTEKAQETYTVTYDLGYDGQKNVVTYSPSRGYTPQTPTRPGYTFLYWTPVEDGVIPEGCTGDITLTAVWKIVTYHILYEGLTNSEKAALPQTFTVEDTVEIPNPSRLGYRFLGWNASLDTNLTIPAGQTGDYVLHANWASLAIQFSIDSNIPSNPVSTYFVGATLELGTEVHASAPVYQDDYQFDHWEINGNTVADTVIYTFPLSNPNTTLKAVYKPYSPTSTPENKAPSYKDIPDAGNAYLTQYVLYQGEQLPLVASTDEEFQKLVEYAVLVGGVLKLQKENKTTGEYELKIYIWGNLNNRLKKGEEILDSITRSVSMPMTPQLTISYPTALDESGNAVTIKVSYNKGLNATKSSYPTSTMTDLQGLLTSSGRATNFEAFPIDALTETATVQTLYELEVLPFGKKPVFASTATEAEQIYNVARDILRQIIDNKMSDYEKVKAIYSWLGLNLTYDNLTASDTEQMTTSSYTIKGALIDHLAVCDGYASAFRLLCQIEGIHAEEVIGLKDLNEPYSGHAWNKVWLGGAVFGVDCTWARQGGGMNSNEIVTLSYLFLDEVGLRQSGHYENAKDGTYWVKDAANASIFLPASIALDAQGHSFVVQSEGDISAMVLYLKKNDLGAAEFYIGNDSLELYSTSEYTIYTTGEQYGYIFLQ